jgi:hypothetical protein
LLFNHVKWIKKNIVQKKYDGFLKKAFTKIGGLNKGEKNKKVLQILRCCTIFYEEDLLHLL